MTRSSNQGSRRNQEESKFLRVFISYSHKDARIAKDIATHLALHGLQPWLDVKLRPGDYWRSEIEHAIRQANVFVLLISPQSLSSAFLSTEWSAIRENTWEHPEKKVFPVLLTELEPPAFLREWQSVSLQEGRIEKIAEQIAEAVLGDAAPQVSRREPSTQELEEMEERFRTLRRVAEEEQSNKGKPPNDEEPEA